jgi:hypothetical protein
MASRQDVAKGREIIARWCNLAEQRLEHLSELFESGRWRRYYGEHAFLDNIREAKTAVETWRDLLSREASRDNRAIDLSWLDRAGTRLPENTYQDDLPHLAEMPETAADQPDQNSLVPEDDGSALNETVSAEPPDEDTLAAVLDLAAIAARYPLLRNTL